MATLKKDIISISLENQELENSMISTASAHLKNELIPIRLVENFDAFVNYISGHVIQLTKTKEYISRKHLPPINEQMTVKAEDCTPYTEQEYYPLIHFFYTIALSGRLLEKVSVKSGKLQLNVTDRLRIYEELTDTEKYFFLLETFWIDVNWAELQGNSYNSIASQLPETFYILNRNNTSPKLGKMVKSQTYDWNYFLLYFEWLGFWICEENLERKEQRGTKSAYFANSITLMPLGVKMIPTLLVSRNLSVWNIAVRRENGEFNGIPGSVLEEVGGGNLSDEDFAQFEMIVEQDQSAQTFFQPFIKLFPKGELVNTLPRNRNLFTDGIYTFKVSLSNGTTWRKVALSAKHSMEDLHKIIIQAFQFDDDHLYSFFMDGKLWSDICIVSPDDDYGHTHATHVQIGKMSLFIKQKFLYLFDYEAEWVFVVEVDEIEEGLNELVKPFVSGAEGAAPQQYGDFY